MEEVCIQLTNQNRIKKSIFTPPRVLVSGFAGVILLGALLLTLPLATVDGEGLNFLDAVFTSTSAVCVTGLVVVDTGSTFTRFGQLVILTLIQIGGLGFMTFATFFAILLGKKISLKERLLLQEALHQVSLEGIVRLAKYVIAISFIIEGLGALILTLAWSSDLGWGKALYYGIFHSISAFNNAGFDLFGTSLTTYVDDWIVNLTVMALIITGGLGFAVLADFYSHRHLRRFSLHSRIVVQTSAILIVIGAIVIFALEFSNPQTLGNLALTDKGLAALFQAVTPRTAGFNTIGIPELRDSTILFLLILMFIGASPGSTGGGVKTTTFVAVVLLVVNILKGKNTVVVKERTLSSDIIQKAVAIMASAMLWIFMVTFLLTITEEADFLTILFEVTSAFGTVGLTMGLTPHLSGAGKLAIILTMFIGRVGLITLVFALAQKNKKTQATTIKYPEEHLIIG